jgi:chromosome partitioning protein
LRTANVIVGLCQQAHRLHVMALNAATARSRLALEAVEVLHSMAPALKTIVHQRQLFASSMIDGCTAGEFDPRSTAAEEITDLWHDITAQLRKNAKE